MTQVSKNCRIVSMRKRIMAARLDALRATSKTLKVLYAVLSDAQKETAKKCSLSAKL